MSEAPLHSYLAKWLAARPAQRVAMPYVRAPELTGHLALAALEHEWSDAAYGIREPQVAQVKLHWWVEELASATASGGRHPLTQALFAAPRAGEIDLALWLAPLEAAMSQVEAATPADFAEQQAVAKAFHGAMARLETCWWYGADADPARAEAHAVIDHLLHALAVLDARHEHERLALPMARMARHGLDRAALAGDSTARRAAVREQLEAIAGLQRQARALRGPLSLFRGLQMRENARLVRRARRAAEPLARLNAMRARPSAGSVLRAWSAAREWRRQEMS